MEPREPRDETRERGRRTRVLLVDDDESLLRALERQFHRLGPGWDVRCAPDGRAAMEIVRASELDLVVVDLLMPVQEGMETLVALRRERPRLPVVVMSGGGCHIGQGYLRHAGLLGARATLEKPFEFEELLRVIRDLLGLARADAPAAGGGRA